MPRLRYFVGAVRMITIPPNPGKCVSTRTKGAGDSCQRFCRARTSSLLLLGCYSSKPLQTQGLSRVYRAHLRRQLSWTRTDVSAVGAPCRAAAPGKSWGIGSGGETGSWRPVPLACRSAPSVFGVSAESRAGSPPAGARSLRPWTAPAFPPPPAAPPPAAAPPPRWPAAAASPARGAESAAAPKPLLWAYSSFARPFSHSPYSGGAGSLRCTGPPGPSSLQAWQPQRLRPAAVAGDPGSSGRPRNLGAGREVQQGARGPARAAARAQPPECRAGVSKASLFIQFVSFLESPMDFGSIGVLTQYSGVLPWSSSCKCKYGRFYPLKIVL